eukprot:m.109611 g.109611  ORF g.109611 m.109611 type:complete len:554 (-) comp15348_c0_seq1:1128-2789(-)
MSLTSELLSTIVSARCQAESDTLFQDTSQDIANGFAVVTTWVQTTQHETVLEVWRCQRRPQSASPLLTNALRHTVKTAVASRLHFSPLNRWLKGVDDLDRAILTSTYPCIEGHRAELTADGFKVYCFPAFTDVNGICYQLTLHRQETLSELDELLQPVIVDKRQTMDTPLAVTTSHVLSRVSSAVLARGSFSGAQPSQPRAIPQPGSPDPRRRHVEALQRTTSWRSTLRNSGRSKLGSFPSLNDDDADADKDDSEAQALEAELATPPRQAMSLSLQSLISPPVSSLSSLSLSPARRPWSRSPTSFRVNLEESLLGNAIPSSVPCTVKGFTVKITTSSAALNPTPVKLPITAKYYHLSDQRFNPYVASLDLNIELLAVAKGKRGRLRVPKKGQLQLVVFNPEQTGVKVFVVPYDMSTIQPLQRTRIRQRTHVVNPSDQSANLLYALHLQLQANRKGRLYLVDDIKMVLASCPPHTEDRVETETQVLDPVDTPPRGQPSRHRVLQRPSCKASQPLVSLLPSQPPFEPEPKPIGAGAFLSGESFGVSPDTSRSPPR